MNPKENKQKKNLRKLREPATVSEARLIENPDTWLLREQALAVDKAQEVMNDLYRERAKYGDGSCAFMVMKEQFEGGVGNPPKPLKDNTLHADKCRQYIKGLQRHRPNLPSEAQQKLIAKSKRCKKRCNGLRNTVMATIRRFLDGHNLGKIS
jgi:hypothetical protein